MGSGPRLSSPLISTPPGFSAPGKVLAPAFYEKDAVTGLPTGRAFDEQGNNLNIVTATTDAATGGTRIYGGAEISRDRLPAIGNIGTRILGVRMGALDNTIQKTFRAVFEIAPGFDAVRPIFANGDTGTTYTVSLCNARALANLTSSWPSLSGIAATACTLPSSGVVPVAPAANRRSFLVGDWIDLSSVARDDGGSGALVCFDAYVSTSASISVLGNGGSDVYTGWASRAKRKALYRNNNGDCVTTPASFTDTTNRNQSPIVGVQYAARGRVITVAVVGDSISDGRGTIIGEGWVVPACDTASVVPTGPYFESANLGVASIASLTFRSNLQDAVTAGIVPDVVVFPNGSPNDFSTSLNTSEILASRKGMASLLRVAHVNKIYPIVWTVLPVNPSVKDFNANDANRVAYNAETLARVAVPVLDFSTALSGVTDGDGQVNMLAGTTSDNIHPNDAGNAILAALLVPKLQQLI